MDIISEGIEPTQEGQLAQEAKGKSPYDELSAIVPKREITLPAETKGGNGAGEQDIESLMAGAPKESDVRVVIKQLFPDLKIPWLNALQMARIYPETIIYLKDIMVKHLVQWEDMTIPEAMATVEVAVGIAFEGEGRIDAIMVMGKAAETEEAKTKGLGIL